MENVEFQRIHPDTYQECSHVVFDESYLTSHAEESEGMQRATFTSHAEDSEESYLTSHAEENEGMQRYLISHIESSEGVFLPILYNTQMHKKKSFAHTTEAFLS